MNHLETLNIDIDTHHGSPGVPSDFNLLKKQLEELAGPQTTMNFNGIERKKNRSKLSPYQMGHSWGCTEALMSFANCPDEQFHNFQGLILISPYLFPKKGPSAFAKTILKTPILSPVILKTFGPKAIQKMLEKSAYPMDIPLSYMQQAQYYMRPEVLKNSILEKNKSANEIHAALGKLEENKVPIFVVWGNADKTSTYEEQILPLKRYSNVQIIEIQNGPHALLWTHSLEVARELSMFIAFTFDSPEKKFDTVNFLDSDPFNQVQIAETENNIFQFLEEHNKTRAHQNILSWSMPEDIKKWSCSPVSSNTLTHHHLSVTELYSLVNNTAAGLIELGVNFGDRVIIFMPMSVPMYVAMFALQKIGAIPVFFDSWARKDQIGASIKVCSPIAIISVDKAFQYFSDNSEINNISIKICYGQITQSSANEIQRNYDEYLEKLMYTPKMCPTAAVTPEHTALITFTTGSSGVPKGADRSHRFLAAQHHALNRHIPYEKNDIDLPVFPIFSLNNLAAGAATVIPAIDVGTPGAFDAAILVAQFFSMKTTSTTLSPSLLNSVAQYCLKNHIQLTHLKRIVTGGAPVSRDDLVKIKNVAPQAEILVLYGSTEVEPMAHIEATEMIKSTDTLSNDQEIVGIGVNVGKIDSGLRAKFIRITKDPIYISSNEDWKKVELEAGEVGELIVSGAHVCPGYYNNQDAFTRSKIKDDHDIIWHRTGDVGKLDKESNLWIVGRVHNTIIRKEQYLFPVRAEIILKKLPFVKEAAFLGIKDIILGEKVLCVVSLHDQNDRNDLNKINFYRDEVKRIMSKNDIPVDGIEFIEKIPMDPRHHSKVEYDVLRKMICS